MNQRPIPAEPSAIHRLNLAQTILLIGLRGYRVLVSPLLTAVFGPMGFGCRFTPTCSCYAIEAVKTHGALRGTWLAACRVGRCHPWGGQGHDPVPPRKSESGTPAAPSPRESREPRHHDASASSCRLSSARDAARIRATPNLISSLHGS